MISLALHYQLTKDRPTWAILVMNFLAFSSERGFTVETVNCSPALDYGVTLDFTRLT